MDITRNGDEEPVYELGDEIRDEDEDLAEPRRLQLDTLLTPDAMAFAGLMLALVSMFGPYTSYVFVYMDETPPKGWLLGPQLALAGSALALGLTAWRTALATGRDVPRFAGATVVISAAILVLLGVIWLYASPSPAQLAG